METNKAQRLVPFIATHPGEVLGDELKERGIKQKDFAATIGVQAGNLNEVIKGKRAMTQDLALKLQQALGIDYSLWMGMQRAYEDDMIAIRQRDAKEQEAVAYESDCNKYANMQLVYKRLGISGKTRFAQERVKYLCEALREDLLSLLQRGGLAYGMYKHSEKLSIEDRNMKAWLLLTRCAIQRTTPEKGYTAGNATKAAREIATMANTQSITEERLRTCLARYGITYMVIENVEKAPIDAYSTSKDGHPIIVVTYRHNDSDKLAFDVLHELCHIDRHINDTESAFISVDGAEYAHDHREVEANKFAESMLIPDEVWNKILGTSTNTLNPYKIVEIVAKRAKEFHISPSIAVARYKHKANWYKTQRYKSKKIE